MIGQGYSPDGTGVFLVEFSEESFVPFTLRELLALHDDDPGKQAQIRACEVGKRVMVRVPSNDWFWAERRK